MKFKFKCVIVGLLVFSNLSFSCFSGLTRCNIATYADYVVSDVSNTFSAAKNSMNQTFSGKNAAGFVTAAEMLSEMAKGLLNSGVKNLTREVVDEFLTQRDEFRRFLSDLFSPIRNAGSGIEQLKYDYSDQGRNFDTIKAFQLELYKHFTKDEDTSQLKKWDASPTNPDDGAQTKDSTLRVNVANIFGHLNTLFTTNMYSVLEVLKVKEKEEEERRKALENEAKNLSGNSVMQSGSTTSNDIFGTNFSNNSQVNNDVVPDLFGGSSFSNDQKEAKGKDEVKELTELIGILKQDFIDHIGQKSDPNGMSSSGKTYNYKILKDIIVCFEKLKPLDNNLYFDVYNPTMTALVNAFDDACKSIIRGGISYHNANFMAWNFSEYHNELSDLNAYNADSNIFTQTSSRLWGLRSDVLVIQSEGFDHFKKQNQKEGNDNGNDSVPAGQENSSIADDLIKMAGNIKVAYSQKDIGVFNLQRVKDDLSELLKKSKEYKNSNSGNEQGVFADISGIFSSVFDDVRNNVGVFANNYSYSDNFREVANELRNALVELYSILNNGSILIINDIPDQGLQKNSQENEVVDKNLEKLDELTDSFNEAGSVLFSKNIATIGNSDVDGLVRNFLSKLDALCKHLDSIDRDSPDGTINYYDRSFFKLKKGFLSNIVLGEFSYDVINNYFEEINGFLSRFFSFDSRYQRNEGFYSKILEIIKNGATSQKQNSKDMSEADSEKCKSLAKKLLGMANKYIERLYSEDVDFGSDYFSKEFANILRELQDLSIIFKEYNANHMGENYLDAYKYVSKCLSHFIEMINSEVGIFDIGRVFKRFGNQKEASANLIEFVKLVVDFCKLDPNYSEGSAIFNWADECVARVANFEVGSKVSKEEEVANEAKKEDEARKIRAELKRKIKPKTKITSLKKLSLVKKRKKKSLENRKLKTKDKKLNKKLERKLILERKARARYLKLCKLTFKVAALFLKEFGAVAKEKKLGLRLGKNYRSAVEALGKLEFKKSRSGEDSDAATFGLNKLNVIINFLSRKVNALYGNKKFLTKRRRLRELAGKRRLAAFLSKSFFPMFMSSEERTAVGLSNEDGSFYKVVDYIIENEEDLFKSKVYQGAIDLLSAFKSESKEFIENMSGRVWNKRKKVSVDGEVKNAVNDKTMSSNIRKDVKKHVDKNR